MTNSIATGDGIHLQHGSGCDCRLLAAATDCSPESIPFSYCRNVLQRRYAMTCKHGDRSEFRAPVIRADAWTDIGAVDAVKAILMANR